MCTVTTWLTISLWCRFWWLQFGSYVNLTVLFVCSSYKCQWITITTITAWHSCISRRLILAAICPKPKLGIANIPCLRRNMSGTTPKAAFEKQFLNTEPTLVTESKLQSRVFQPHRETINEYHSSTLSLVATLGRASEQLATNFMNGLPKSIKDRLYLARHPSGAKAVRFENQFPMTKVTAGANTVNAIAQGFKQLKVHMSSRARGHARAHGYGRTQYGCINSPHRGRGYYRRAALSPRGRGFSGGRGSGRGSCDRSRTPSTGRVNQNDRGGACYRCGDPYHWANECPKWPLHDDDNNIHDSSDSNVNHAPKLSNVTANDNGCDNDGEQMPKPANVNECDNDVKQSLDPTRCCKW